MGWARRELRLPSVCPPAPPVLYPNLAELEDYLGLALSGEEIRRNPLPAGSTVGVRAGGSARPARGPPPLVLTGVPPAPHPARGRADVRRAGSIADPRLRRRR